MLEKYKYDPIAVFINVINKIIGGERKIYGIVTPNDIKEMIDDELEVLAIDREFKHNERKGHGEVEISKRHSGRISDITNK